MESATLERVVVVTAAVAVVGVQMIRWLRANGGARLVVAWLLLSLVALVAMSVVPGLLALTGHNGSAWDVWLAESALAALAVAAMQVTIWQVEFADGHHAVTSSSSAKSSLKVVRSSNT